MSHRTSERLACMEPEQSEAEAPLSQHGRLRSMLKMLGLEATDVHAYCHRALSQPQLMQILGGRHTPSQFERKVLTLALSKALQDRSTLLFEG